MTSAEIEWAVSALSVRLQTIADRVLAIEKRFALNGQQPDGPGGHIVTNAADAFASDSPRARQANAQKVVASATRLSDRDLEIIRSQWANATDHPGYYVVSKLLDKVDRLRGLVTRDEKVAEIEYENERLTDERNRLRVALKEALDAWEAGYAEYGLTDEQVARIAELRRLLP